MTEVGAWVLFPLLILLACVGCGLLAERAAHVRLPPGLVVALGLASAMVLLGPSYELGFGEVAAVVVLAVATGSGLLLGLEGLRERFTPGAAAAAGAVVYALYMLPVLFTGEATFLGYNLLNDTAVHLLLVDHLAEHGRHGVSLPPSSTSEALDVYIGKSYPVGSHELLATLQAPLAIDAVHLYQPFIATSAGLGAAAVTVLVRGFRVPGRVAAAAAVLAFSSQLLFSFDLQGGLKEIGFVAVLATAAAVGHELLRSEAPVRSAALLGVSAAAGFAIYGLAALAWLAPLGLLIALWALFERGSPLRRRLPAAAAAGVVAFVILGAPAIVGSFEFYDKGQDDLTSESELGPLVGPIRAIQTTGIWLKGDYRQLPDQGGRKSYLLGGVALVLAVLGVAFALRRRVAGPLLFLVPSLVAWLAVKPSSSPYIDAKLLAVLSPAVLLAAAIGVGALWAAARRVEAAAAALVLVAAVGLSDVLAYRHAQPAPLDRLLELRQIGERFAGDELLLVNEHEEYAKYFAREARPFVPYDGFSRYVEARRPERPQREGDRRNTPPVVYTLDELELDYVTRFPRIAVRRSPAESRPPAGYERSFAGRWYELWERTGDTPSSHLPFGKPRRNPYSATSTPRCSAIPDEQVIAALRPEAVLFDIADQEELPAGWKRAPRLPLALDANTGGVVRATAETEAGRHRVWIRGTLFRGSTLLVDGEEVGVARATQGPEQWVDAGTVEVDAGRHTLELRRPRRSLDPGDARSDVFGPVVLVPDEEPALERGSGKSFCGESLDWVERP